MNTVEESATMRDYGFLMFITLLNVMNFVDRQLLASFGNWIKPELELTNTEFGILTGLAFLLFYSVGGLFMGALADKSYHRAIFDEGRARMMHAVGFVCATVAQSPAPTPPHTAKGGCAREAKEFAPQSTT